MSQQEYEALFTPGSSGDPATDLVKALAQAGRLRRAAHDLATAEMLEGLYVETEVDETDVRLAADDRSSAERTLSAGPYKVRIERDASGSLTATQIAGPSGATLKVAEAWIPLTLDKPAPLPGSTLPETVVLVDVRGKEHKLR